MLLKELPITITIVIIIIDIIIILTRAEVSDPVPSQHSRAQVSQDP